MDDKEIEKIRYDTIADVYLNINNSNFNQKQPEYINIPNKYYFDLLAKLDRPSKLLEIGSGIGANTKELLNLSFEVCATDISSKSLELIKKRFSHYKNFSTVVADMENLPFNDKSFDVVCVAGSLSYGDNETVMNEIYRVLKKGGFMVALDSLNNNPIYRINRYFNFLRGKRTISTLKRMPDLNLIQKYREKFGCLEIKYFGSLAWTFPFLRIFLSTKMICDFSNWVDAKLNIKASAFKFVMKLQKKIKL